MLKEGLDILKAKHIPPYTVIHICVHCDGIDPDFKFCAAGANRLTLQEMSKGKISGVVTQFSHTIQSGKYVTLHDHTIICYAYIPPTEYR